MSSLDAAGVDYGSLDESKVTASQYALRTAGFAIARYWKELAWTRGESAYAMQNERSKMIIAVVIEGLGTKNLVAEDPQVATLVPDAYRRIAVDNVAMIVNDLITIGAMPLIFMMHPALAEGNHLSGRRGKDLAAGTYEAMHKVHAVWGPGETPELNGIIVPGTMCLSGAVVGTVDREGHLINSANLKAGHRILMLGSSGIHANGLSRARKIAASLPAGYLTPMDSGRMFGEALLDPTELYVHFIQSCQDINIPFSYAVNMTGHGWRKVMRAVQPFTYRIESVPEPHEVFRFMQKHGSISDEEAYKAFNMGAGFCLMLEEQHVAQVKELGRRLEMPVLDAGVVEDGPKRVIIEPLGLTLHEHEMKIR